MSTNQDGGGFEQLKADFPVFTIENRLNIAKGIPIANGEELLVPPKATVEVSSSHLYQMPDSTVFRVKNPTTADLVLYGILKTVTSEAPVESKPSGKIKPSSNEEVGENK